MGAKKDKHIAILTYKENKFKEIAKNMKTFNVNQQKIDDIEARETRYKNWKDTIVAGPDY